MWATSLKIIILSHPTILYKKFVIIAPYRSQIEAIEGYINQTIPFLKNRVARKKFALHILNVDSIQGSERDFILFSATRYKISNDVDLLTKSRRMNVYVTRAHFLNTIIEDTSTVMEKVVELQ